MGTASRTTGTSVEARETARASVAGQRAWAVVLGVLTVVAYLPGSTRAFEYDGAVTTYLFIRRPLGTALRDQYVTNNHHYFSFLEQLFSKAIGSSSEMALRILPIAFAGAAVALVAGEALRRFGWLPGTAAAAVLATNPLFLAHSREVRGYSLLVLCAVASTLVVMRGDTEGPWPRLTYVGSVGIGIGTHLFMAWVVLAQVVHLLTRRRLDGEWVFRLVAGIAVGAIPYILTIDIILGQGRQRTFDAGFPFDVVRDVLGKEPVTACLIGVLVLVALWPLRRQRLTWRLAAVGALAVLVAWVAPNTPGTRFFVWAVPAVAIAAAAAVRVRPVLAVAVVVAVVLGVFAVAPGYTEDSLGNRRVAPIVAAAAASGRRVCGLGGSAETLPVYLERPIPQLFDRVALARCDVVVVVIRRFEPALVASVRPAFRYERVVPARESTLVWSKEPLELP